MNYRTPGVYVEEISLLPPSVAQVETAIPAFIGYTEKAAGDDGKPIWNVPTRIKSLLEYETYFGGSHKQSLLVTLADTAPFTPQSVSFNGGESPYRMHQALQLYFGNGGGPCFIISVGDFDSDTPRASLDAIDDYNELKAGLDAARKIDEITLLVFPEADRLSASNQVYDLYKDVLSQCYDLKDRFGVFDVLSDDSDGIAFRDNIGVNNLSYGAAYYPYLDSKITYSHDDAGVTFATSSPEVFRENTLAEVANVAAALNYMADVQKAKAQADKAVADAGTSDKAGKLAQYKIALRSTENALNNAQRAMELVIDPAFDASDLEEAETELKAITDLTVTSANTMVEIDTATTALAGSTAKSEAAATIILAKINGEQKIAEALNPDVTAYFTNAFLADLRNLLAEFTMAMPPSSAVVGIYARTDATRGVWKAPANVSINLINGPMVKVDNTDNDSFNVHPTGKSINVIRAFTGKGTLVWGARTLDGNSNEWRYVPVRRFFNMVEESVKKASEQFVFENNDANTWVKVKAMIENFLILQWRAGALMGSKPEQAFFVNVGLGQTMTPDDVFNGRMIVEIGMAVVRPAEFIILRFSHKMLES